MNSRLRFTPSTLRSLALGAIVAAALAIGLHTIAVTFVDPTPMPAVGRQLLDASPVTRLWTHGWLALNEGQFDPRLFALTSLLLETMAFAAVLGLLARHLKLRWCVVLGVAGLCLPLCAGFTTLRPIDNLASGSALVLFSALHLALLPGHTPRGVRWWGGLLAGIGAAWCGPAGLASAAAIVVGCVAAREWRSSFFTNLGVLVAGGIGWAIRGDGGPSGFGGIALLEFPWANPFALLLVWAPAAFTVITMFRRRVNGLGVPAAWATLLIATLAWRGTFDLADAAVPLAAAVIVGLACFTLLPATNVGGRTLNFVLLSAWLVPMFDGLTHPPALPTHDATVAPVAGPLPLHAEANTGFMADAAPDLPGRDGLPSFGTWPRTGSAGAAQFVSAPITTRCAYVQIRVCGTLRPPATSLVLRLEDGAEVKPLNAVVDAHDRWRRVNFPAPRGPFRIVARNASPTEWIAFSAPVEMGALTRLAGKITPLWPASFFVAAALAVIAGSSAWRSSGGLRPASRQSETGATASAGLRKGEISGMASGAGAEIHEPFLYWRPLPWVLVLGYAMFLWHHVDPTAGPNDSGGYLNSAKLLASGQVTAAPRLIFGPATANTDLKPYVPITFHVRDDGRLVPEYPVGWPMEVALFAKVFGFETGIRILMLLQLVLGVIMTQRLARAMGLAERWSWLAAMIVGLCPVYLFEALQPLSDGPALVWVTIAVYCGWRSREHARYAVYAGLTTAIAVLIRPANVLSLLPVALCFWPVNARASSSGAPTGVDARAPSSSAPTGAGGVWRRLMLWALAGLPGALWLLWYQHALYGHALRTGYGEDAGSGFGFRFVAPTLGSYAQWLPEFFTPIVLLALAAPFMRTIPGRVRLVLGGWVAIFMTFYAFYWCTWDTWFNMRFLLPAAPAMAILALLVLQRSAERASELSQRIAFGALAAVAGTFLLVRDNARDVLYWPGNNHEHAVIATWVRDHLPPEAVIYAKHATGSLFFYTNLPFVRTDHEPAKSPEFLAALERTGRPIYAVTYHWETRGYDWKSHGTGYPDVPGKWRRIASLWNDDAMVWQRENETSPARRQQ